MQHNYLGEIEFTSLVGTPYEGFTSTDWAIVFIERYGQIDGDHHKAWVLDQVARILKGTKVNVRLAKWDSGIEEYRISTDRPSEEYGAWVKEMLGELDECGDYEYEYAVGVAP